MNPGLFIPRVLREISSSNLKFSTKFSFHVSVLSTPFVQIFPFFQTTLYLTSTHQQKTIFFLAVFFSHIVIPELIKISQTLHIDLRLFWMQIMNFAGYFLVQQLTDMSLARSVHVVIVVSVLGRFGQKPRPLHGRSSGLDGRR